MHCAITDYARPGFWNISNPICAAKRAAMRGMPPVTSSTLTTWAWTCSGVSPLRRSMKVISIGASDGTLA